MVSLLRFAQVCVAVVVSCMAQAHAREARNRTMPMTMERFNLQEGFLECATAPPIAEDRRFDRSGLTYATYNVEFLYLQGLGQLKCPGTQCKWKNVEMAELHLLQIAQDIYDLNVDIVQLNEVEDCNVLNALVSALAAMGDDSYKPYLIRGLDTYTSQNAALLARVDPVTDMQRNNERVTLPVPDSTCPGASSSSSRSKTKGVTKHFYTTFNVTGFSKPITIVGAHFLSRPDDKRRCTQREAQATVVSRISKEALAQDHHVIISGDMNDFDGAVLDRNDNTPISNVMGLMTGSSFINVASKVSQSNRYTQWWDRNDDCIYELDEVSSLDHILVSKGLARNIDNVLFGHQLFQQSCESYGSDHYPVMITLRAEKM